MLNYVHQQYHLIYDLKYKFQNNSDKEGWLKGDIIIEGRDGLQYKRSAARYCAALILVNRILSVHARWSCCCRIFRSRQAASIRRSAARIRFRKCRRL